MALAVLLAIVAIGIYLPARAGNATIVLAAALGLGFWVVGENFGALFTNSATDVNSGPLLVLLAVAFWRPRPTRQLGVVWRPARAADGEAIMNMSGPGWLGDIFAAVMLVVAAYSAGRLVASRAWSRPAPLRRRHRALAHGCRHGGDVRGCPQPRPVRRMGGRVLRGSGVVLVAVRRLVTRRHGRGLSRACPRCLSTIQRTSSWPSPCCTCTLRCRSRGATVGAMAGSGATGASADFVGLPLLFLLVLLGSGVWELDRAERSRRARLAGFSAFPIPDPAPAVALAAVPSRRPDPGRGPRSRGWGPARAGGDGVRAPEAVWVAPGLMAASHVVMCIAMAYMLVVML